MKWLNRLEVQAGIVGALTAFSGLAAATQPLDVFLDKANAQAFDAREAAATERQRSAEADAALGRLIPALSARGTYTRNQTEVAATFPGQNEQLVITPQDQLDAVFQLDVPILDLANYYRYGAARAVERSAEAQRDATSIDVSRSVVRAYYQYLGAAALVRSAGESVSAANANHENVGVRQGAGAATELDLERAFANVARAQQDLADAQLGVALAGRSLETLSGLTPQPADGSLQEDDLHPEGPLQGWLDLAAQSPATRVATQQREAADANLKAARAALLPTLAASAQERVSNATGFAGRTNNYAVQLILSWRLDYGVLATQQAQGAALEAQHVRLQRTQRAVSDAAFEAYQRVQAGIVKSRAARAQAQAAGRAA